MLLGGWEREAGDGPTAASMRFSDLCRVGCWEEEAVVCFWVRVGGIVGFGAWVGGDLCGGRSGAERKRVVFVLVVFWARDCRVG